MEGLGVVYIYTCKICQNDLGDAPTGIKPTKSTKKLVALDCGHTMHLHCATRFFGRKGDKSDGMIKCPDPGCTIKYNGLPKIHFHTVVLEPKSVPILDLAPVKALQRNGLRERNVDAERTHDLARNAGAETEIPNDNERIQNLEQRIASLEQQRPPLSPLGNKTKPKQRKN